MDNLKTFIDGLLASGAKTFPREALEKIAEMASDLPDDLSADGRPVNLGDKHWYMPNQDVTKTLKIEVGTAVSAGGVAGATTSWVNDPHTVWRSLTGVPSPLGLNTTAAANPFKVNMYPSTCAAAACQPPTMVYGTAYLGGGK